MNVEQLKLVDCTKLFLENEAWCYLRISDVSYGDKFFMWYQANDTGYTLVNDCRKVSELNKAYSRFLETME